MRGLGCPCLSGARNWTFRIADLNVMYTHSDGAPCPKRERVPAESAQGLATSGGETNCFHEAISQVDCLVPIPKYQNDRRRVSRG
ncbi:hypothetical protein VTN49DRAFT_492 [Thermomyces lanuginosus]|uniref:uncharacterized protein n=1 Tax=Thermomyces lanuginosus TaxID=5541 RepID=UPI003744A607